MSKATRSMDSLDHFALLQMFDTLDTDNNGFLDRSGFGTLLSLLGMNIGKDSTDYIWHQIGAANVGRLTKADLLKHRDQISAVASGSMDDAQTSGPGEPEVLLVKKLSPGAIAPVRASTHAAGYDLFAAKSATIPAKGRLVVPTDVAIALPPRTYGRIAPRSGLAVKNGIDVGAGVIDEDYRGNVMVLLFNHADVDFIVNKGDRIAQLLIERIATPLVEVTDDLDVTQRGSGGFGSTGTSTIVNGK